MHEAPVRVGNLIEDAYPWRDPREAVRFALKMFAEVEPTLPEIAKSGARAARDVLRVFASSAHVPWRRSSEKRAMRREAARAWWASYICLTSQESAATDVLRAAIEIVTRSCNQRLSLADRRFVAKNVWKIIDRVRKAGVAADIISNELFKARLRDATHGQDVDQDVQLAFEGVWLAGECEAAYRLFFKRVYRATT